MEGTAHKIGEREFIVPRLRIGTYRRVTVITAEIDDSALKISAGSQATPEQAAGVLRWFEVHCRAIHEVLRRNYPDLTVGEIEDLVDMDAVQAELFAVMKAAGRKRSEAGEPGSP